VAKLRRCLGVWTNRLFGPVRSFGPICAVIGALALIRRLPPHPPSATLDIIEGGPTMCHSRQSQWNPMALLTFLPLTIALVLFVTPAFLIRRPAYFGAKEDFAPSDHVLPTVIQNSSVAYGVGLATLGPVLAWGASGDFWPAIVYTIFVGSGLSIVYVLRRPI